MKRFATTMFLFATLATAAAAQQPRVEWREWSRGVFAEARKEDKLVLLDLGAVWCHWCHVMDEETYGDAEVARLLRRGFIAVKVDQAERPDLANRYEDYGWPATIIFDGTGRELAKLRGFMAPQRMRSLLRAFIADPTPGPSVRGGTSERISSGTAAGGTLSAEARKRLVAEHFAQFDEKEAGWGSVHKFLSMHPVEYSLDRALRGDERARTMARRTLDAQLHLLDPVWGGVYQYSHGGVWTEPHFEKIMSMQADDIRIYARAWRVFGDGRYRRAAESVAGYLSRFLTAPDGSFYTSQDADLVPGEHAAGYFALDDRGRRKLGIPAVDRHRYARENGLAIRALAALHGATGDRRHLDAAVKAACWAVADRAIEGGGFRHDAEDDTGPFLGDTLAMGQAFEELWTVTGDREWLGRAVAAGSFILARFRRDVPGLATAARRADEVLPPGPQRDENVEAVRFLVRLHHATGRDDFLAEARRTLRWLVSPRVAHRPTAGVLLAEYEARTDPLEVTIVGRRDDAGARALLATAAALPDGFRRVVRWHPAEGPPPDPSISYPAGDRAAAYVCAGAPIAAPVAHPQALVRTVEKMRSRDE